MLNPIQYPVQIQADNSEAGESTVACMCHVFDQAGYVTVFGALARTYLHVIAWDAEIEKLESQLVKYQNIKQGMMQQLLTGKIRLL